MGRAERIAVCTLLCLGIGATLAVGFGTAAEPDPSAGPIGYWERLPRPPGRSMFFHSIAIEPGDILWVMAGTGVHYWDGQEYRSPAGPELDAGANFIALFGGSDRPLYLTQPGKQEHQGELYRLSDGRALYLTDFYYEDAGCARGVYVAKDGRLFNWANDFLAVHTTDGWKRREAATSHNQTLVFDTPEAVCFYYPDKLYTVDANNRFGVVDVAIDFRLEKPHVMGALWGSDKALVLAYGGKGIHAFHLPSGEPVDVAGINRAFGDRMVWDLFRTREGSVWVLALCRKLQKDVFFRIAPEGDVSMIEKTAGFGWKHHQFRSCSRIVLDAADGSLWFGLFEEGLLHYKDGRAHQFDGREGLDLTGCLSVLEDSRGTVYAMSSRGLYAFHRGQAAEPDVQPQIRRPFLPERVAWKDPPERFDMASRAWGLGKSIVITSERTGTLILDAATGKQRAGLDISNHRSRYASIVPGRGPDEMLLSVSGEIRIVDVHSGKVIERARYPLGWHIPPVPLDDGYLVATSGLAYDLARIDRHGKEIWGCQVSGNIDAPLAVGGSIAVVQTRYGGYGGQATSGIDLESGERLWRDRIDAYGYGAVFPADASYVVEADAWLSPKATEGWLICRNPATGQRLWHYRRESNTISNPPVIDSKLDRVFAVFDRGEMVCLDAGDGALRWETRLPERPYCTSVGASRDNPWPILEQRGGRLRVLDRNRVLHLLDAGSGRVVASIALTTAFSPDGKSMAPVPLLAMPSICGDNLIVTTSKGLAAYPIREVLQRN